MAQFAGPAWTCGRFSAGGLRMTNRSFGHPVQLAAASREAVASVDDKPAASNARDEKAQKPEPNNTGSEDIVNYIPALRIYARSLTRDRVDADDLVQETLVRGLASIHSYQPGTNMRAWLFTIMRNRFYTNSGKSAREPTGETDCVASVLHSAADTQMWHLRRREMVRALLDLPVHYREAILLVGVLGESYKDAATILNCDIGTIKSRVNRARVALSEAIDAPVAE